MPAASMAASAIIPQVKYMFQHQPDAVLNQANPVQNTWYTVLPATDDVRIITIIGVVQTADETIEGRLTIDGVVIQILPINFTFGTVYEAYNSSPYNAFFTWNAPPVSGYRSFLIEGQNVKFEIRKTTAAGAGALFSRIKWAQLLPT
jgi:hypothetical protein